MLECRRSEGGVSKLAVLAAIAFIAIASVLALSLGGFLFVTFLFLEQAEVAIRQHPVVQERLGVLTSVEHEWLESIDDSRSNFYVFSLSGEKGEALLRGEFESVDAETEEIVGGSLLLSSGEEVELSLGSELSSSSP